MTERSFLSVIIPAYQAEDNIKDVLLSLKWQDYPRDKLEIIVIISGEDSTLDICEDLRSFIPNLRIYHYSKRISAGRARNIGASFAKGEIFLFIDADCIAPPNWINLILEDFEEFPEIVGVLGVYSGGKSFIEKSIGGELILNKKRIDAFPSFLEGNCAFKKIVFDKECKFGNITYGEGTILAECMKGHNFKMLLDPNIHLKHLGSISSLKYIKMGKMFYFWYLKPNLRNKVLIIRAFLSTAFVMTSLILLILLPLNAYLPFVLFGIPLYYFFVCPFILVNMVFAFYIKQDYLISSDNKIKYFPLLIGLRWLHQFGYFLGSLKALSFLLKVSKNSNDETI